jgi:hypothetical protein
MADRDFEAIDSTVQKTHEWLGAIAEASQLGKDRRAVLVAGYVLTKFAVAVIPVVIIVGLSVIVIAAFVGGYLAALR